MRQTRRPRIAGCRQGRWSCLHRAWQRGPSRKSPGLCLCGNSWAPGIGLIPGSRGTSPAARRRAMRRATKSRPARDMVQSRRARKSSAAGMSRTYHEHNCSSKSPWTQRGAARSVDDATDGRGSKTGRSPSCHNPRRCIQPDPVRSIVCRERGSHCRKVAGRSSGCSRRILPRAPTREQTASIVSRSPLPTCSSWAVISILPKPALSRMPRTRPGLAKANGPGASGS